MAKPQFAPTPQAYALANTLNGAVLSIYLGGTTTPATVYSDRTLTTPLGTTLTADSLGRFANFFVDASTNYKYVLSHASIADITFDYSVTSNELLDSSSQVTAQFTGDGTTVAFTVTGSELTDAGTLVALDGLVQAKGTYTVVFGGTDTVVTFDAAPVASAVIDVWNLLLLGAKGDPGPAVADGDKGDIVVSGSGTAYTIDTSAVTTAKINDLAVSTAKIADDAVTYAKLQQVTANSFLARAAATDGDASAVALAASQLAGRGASGDVAAIGLGAGLSMSGTTLSATGGGLPRSYLAGLGMANNATDATNDIDFAAGTCRDSTNAADITCSALTKRLDAAWAVGTAAGGLDTGSIADTTYHCFAIKKDSDGSGDFLFSTSATSPTMPSGYTYFRRIGSIVRASAAIRLFVQDGDRFNWRVPVNDVNAVSTTSASTRTLTVPAGVRVRARMAILFGEGSNTATALLVSDLSETDSSPSVSLCTGYAVATGPTSFWAPTYAEIMTNTSAQVRSRSSTNNTNLYINTVGWTDTRGRDA